MPLLNHSNEKVTYAFIDKMLNRLSVPTMVLTDQDMDFQGDFQDLCEKTLIIHWTISRDHPEANGLAEWMVQTMKQELRNYGHKKGHIRYRDLQLPCWPWDIGLVDKPHWHFFHHIFCYSVKISSYKLPFDMMLWLWLVSMILQCGFRNINSGLLCSSM
jgi:transposase InsO family protein